MTGPIILGRTQGKAMGYVKFPKIQCPHTFTTNSTTLKRICTDKTHTPEIANDTAPTNSTGQVYGHKSESTRATQVKWSKQTEEPRGSKIKWNTNPIELNGKVHRPPKDYILREYNDVFKGIGTLPGRPYHIRLKEQYRLVQYPTRSAPVAMQSAYRTESNRLVKEGIITEHTEWINSIIPAMKSNGNLRLCLNPKDLNKAIERNQ